MRLSDNHCQDLKGKERSIQYNWRKERRKLRKKGKRRDLKPVCKKITWLENKKIKHASAPVHSLYVLWLIGTFLRPELDQLKFSKNHGWLTTSITVTNGNFLGNKTVNELFLS